MVAEFRNTLFYGDNLAVMREHIADESVDLVYLDPPFKSNQDYNVLFKEQSGERAAAQIKAFEDTWCWDESAAAAYEEVISSAHLSQMHERTARALEAFRMMLGTNDMLAYLAMMAPRLMELRRVLKETGSIYLHCDPTASHYLKLLMDGVFGGQMFRNEITWKRADAHSDGKQGAKHYGRITDTILFFCKNKKYTFNTIYNPLSEETARKWYRHVDPETGQRYNMSDLTAAKAGGDTKYELKGAYPPKGRYWAYTKEKMEEFDKQGRIVLSKSGKPYYKRYLHESKGVPLQSLWTDISQLRGFDARKERLGYPTQKPEALLERIIQASSNEGDVVLDPFCGCGTAVAAAEKLNRRWLGIDITHLAVTLMKQRLLDSFGIEQKKDYAVIGEPESISGARQLAKDDAYQFQYWALGLVGARPHEKKKGADHGIDGQLRWIEDARGAKSQHLIISVKSGKNVSVAHIRDLVGTIDREKAAIGVYLTLTDPTKPMKTEAASAGIYTSLYGPKFPRIQILTIKELLAGKRIERPYGGQADTTFAKAQRVKTNGPETSTIEGLETNPNGKKRKK